MSELIAAAEAQTELDALVARLHKLADPLQTAVPAFADTDWRGLAYKCASVITELRAQAAAQAEPASVEPVAHLTRFGKSYLLVDDAITLTPDLFDERGECKLYASPDAKRVARMESALKRILDEPNNTMSDGKALREIIRIARAAVKE